MLETDIQDITAIILTLNEEMHLARCLSSVAKVASRVVVIDSFSTDRTIDIAAEFGAEVLQNPFTTHANQFNWGLLNAKIVSPWVLRVDADEYLSSKLITEITNGLGKISPEVEGVVFGRTTFHRGQRIKYGGLYPAYMLRLFRNGKGRCEDLLMDEHIVVAGRCITFSGELIDHNLRGLFSWTLKHNDYSSREALEIIQRDQDRGVEASSKARHIGTKRWLKDKVYLRIPSGLRAFLYFFYRYILRLGFFDGRIGFEFHFLQAFWYRLLVDAKLAEIDAHSRDHGVSRQQSANRLLGLKLENELGIKNDSSRH